MWGLEFYAVIYCIMIAVFALGAIAFHLTAQQIETEVALREWAKGSWLLVLGCLLAVLARSQISQPEEMYSYQWPALLRSLATVINGYAWLRIWFGFRYYYHLPRPDRRSSLMYMSALLLTVFAAHPLKLPAAWAVIIISLWLAGCVVVILRDTWQHSNWRSEDQFAMAGFVVAGTMWLYRAVSLMPEFFSGVEWDVNRSVDNLVMVITLVALMSIYLGMTLLIYRRLIDKLRTQASTDGLTGALNRREFMERGEALLALAKREGRPIAVALMDLDFFKRINDDHGHQTGDQVLKLTVDTALGELREQDVFARYGGEEFVAFFPDTTLQQAESALRRFRQQLSEQTLSSEGREVSVTVSVGLVAINPADETLEELIKRADEALYQAKDDGRNRVTVWFNPSMVESWS